MASTNSGAQSAEAALGIDPKLYHADEILARIALEDNDLKKAAKLRRCCSRD